MKKNFIFILVSASLLLYGCQSTQTASTRLISNASASSCASMGAGLAQVVNDSMVSWTQNGSVTGEVATASVSTLKGGAVKAQTITGPDANSYYHITEEVSSAVGTYETDLYVKITTNESGKVTDTYIYGTLALSVIAGGSRFSYTMTYGSGSASPYHGTATWSGNTLSSIAASGPLALSVSVTEGSTTHTTALSYALSGFTLPVTAGADYPTGTMTVTLTYDGATDSNTFRITFNGTSTATVTYGDYTTVITVTST